MLLLCHLAYERVSCHYDTEHLADKLTGLLACRHAHIEQISRLRPRFTSVAIQKRQIIDLQINRSLNLEYTEQRRTHGVIDHGSHTRHHSQLV